MEVGGSKFCFLDLNLTLKDKEIQPNWTINQQIAPIYKPIFVMA